MTEKTFFKVWAEFTEGTWYTLEPLDILTENDDVEVLES